MKTVKTALARLRMLGGAALLASVAFGPFVVYLSSQDSAVQASPKFPSDVLLLAHDGAQLREVGLMRSAPVPGIVRFPPDMALTLPRAGNLRAGTAFAIVEERVMADAISATLGIKVPFWYEAQATSVAAIRFGTGRFETNLGGDLQAAAAAFARGKQQTWRADGVYQLSGVTRSFHPDVRKVRAALRDPRLRTDPKPKPTVVPKNTEVEVLRKAGATGAGTAAANVLKKKGFKITRIGNSAVTTKPELTFVFYVRNKAMGDAVAKALGLKGVVAQKMPKGVSSRSDVLVLAGRDALAKPAAKSS